MNWIRYYDDLVASKDISLDKCETLFMWIVDNAKTAHVDNIVGVAKEGLEYLKNIKR